MNELPRQKLREVVARHGREVARDARRVEGLLRDHSGGHRREVSALVAALEEHVPADMLDAPADTPREVVLARMARRLADNRALSESAARWSVNSWALALGLISEDELRDIERRDAPSEDAATSPAEGGPADDERAARTSSATPSAARTGGPAVVVSARGDGDFTSIAEAVRHAAPGARLLVRPGQYADGIVLDKQVEIVGDGPREQIVVECAGASCLQMQTESARVAGLTLRASARDGAAFFAVDIPRGRLLLEDCDISSETLSCVAAHGPAAAPLVRRCHVHGGADSGLYFFDEATGTVEDCRIYENANVGVAVTGRASVNITRSRIHDGASAGVVAWQEGVCLVEDSDIYANRLAGLGVSEGAKLTARSCRVYEGENSGVFVHREGEAVLEGCDLHGHRNAEAAVTTRGRLFLDGCRVRRGRDSGVFLRDEGQALLKDCDVSEHADSGATVGAGSVLAVLSSRVNGNARFAVRVAEGATARVEDSDLSGNGLGAWDTERGANVEAERNSE
ncbi:MAG TPA: right-handed parallel beta-helix repeat-containing protein [Pyrinomonadaceae bacterium]|nr:right-handed parallel beta-helix repeat-containing protein [Pyrinomonadaceae bacterium]